MSLSKIRDAQNALYAVRAGNITIDDIPDDVMAAGRAFVCWRTDVWNDATDDWVYLNYDQMLADARAANRAQFYDPSDPSCVPGSGAVVRDGYDGTQMPGRDYNTQF